MILNRASQDTLCNSGDSLIRGRMLPGQENQFLMKLKRSGYIWMIGFLLVPMFLGCSTHSSNGPAPGNIPGTPIVQSTLVQSSGAPVMKNSSEKNSEASTVQSPPPPAPAHAFNNDVQAYKLQVEDEIEIKFHLVPELNDLVKVRPDGKISLQIIDEVEVLGLAPSELDQLLTKKYSKTLRDPDLTVIVRQFSGQKVFVGGEVNSQGLVPIHGRLTVTQAIMQAGGFKDSAELENVVLLRNQGKKDPYFAVLDLENNLKDPMGGLASNGVVLQPYDVVFVPKSTIATIDQFIDQYINKVVPRSFQWGFQWVTNLGTGGIVP